MSNTSLLGSDEAVPMWDLVGVLYKDRVPEM